MNKEDLVETLNCFNSSDYRSKYNEIKTKCYNIITDTLKLAKYHGHNKIDFTVTSDYLCDMSSSLQTVKIIDEKEVIYDYNELYVHLYDENSKRTICKSLLDCDAIFLLNTVEYINDYLSEFLDYWSK